MDRGYSWVQLICWRSGGLENCGGANQPGLLVWAISLKGYYTIYTEYDSRSLCVRRGHTWWRYSYWRLTIWCRQRIGGWLIGMRIRWIELVLGLAMNSILKALLRVNWPGFLVPRVLTGVREMWDGFVSGRPFHWPLNKRSYRASS